KNAFAKKCLGVGRDFAGGTLASVLRKHSRACTHKSAFCKRGSVNVRFAPKATEVLRCRELTRCAISRHRGEKLSLARCRAHANVVVVTQGPKGSCPVTGK